MDLKVIKAKVDDELKGQFRERAKKEGRTESHLLRKALKNYLNSPIVTRK